MNDSTFVFFPSFGWAFKIRVIIFSRSFNFSVAFWSLKNRDKVDYFPTEFPGLETLVCTEKCIDSGGELSGFPLAF